MITLMLAALPATTEGWLKMSAINGGIPGHKVPGGNAGK
jgi:hypothetical protein